LGFPGKAGGKAGRTPNPNDSFATKELVCLGAGDFRLAPIILTSKIVKIPYPSFGYPPKGED